MEHPDPQELLDYQEERLEREAANRVREHLGTCDWCLDDFEDNLREKLRADLDRLDEREMNAQAVRDTCTLYVPHVDSL